MAAERTHDATVPALLAEHRQQVRDIIDAVLPGARVLVFGSRSTGRARPFSDLDLLFESPSRLAWVERAALRERFEASDLPFCVDVVDADGLSAALRLRVAAEARPL